MKRVPLALALLLLLGLSSCRYRSWQHVAAPPASAAPQLEQDGRAQPLADTAEPLTVRPHEAHVVGPLDPRPLPAAGR